MSVESRIPRPPFRRLAIYAFDPALDVENKTASFARDIVTVPWPEKYDSKLEIGPTNEYLEVVDVDPSSGRWYEPVNLDHPWLLAQDGHRPSEGNPQFHQQMAFAVAMRTIGQFEAALGRRVLWSSPRDIERRDEYVQRLRIYPHALRGENAYYSPTKKALLLGYFQANQHDERSVPGGWVFGCLSHDVIAHETTHAILDGINPHFIEDTEIDALAFHEGFADIVALLQHFTFRTAVAATIADQKDGRLDATNLLSSIADQFGRASVKRALKSTALRDAVASAGSLDPYSEAHDRGARLLAAVYSAFAELYDRAANDLRIIANPQAYQYPMHPSLVAKLAEMTGKIAERLLRMCIRALDLLPPASVTFTDFLRAIVTSDSELYPSDENGYRRALIAAFRRYGAVREGVRSLSEDSLIWPNPAMPNSDAMVNPPKLDTEPLYKRSEIFEQARNNARNFHGWIVGQPAFCKAIGLYVDSNAPQTVARKDGRPTISVHSVRSSRRVTADGRGLRQLVVGLSQRRFGFFDPEQQKGADLRPEPCTDSDFILRGGATVMFDLMGERDTPYFQRVRYVVRQSLDDARLEEARQYHVNRAAMGLGVAYSPSGHDGAEPLALLHAARRL